MSERKRHAIIPDCQVKPGVPMNNLAWFGKYVAEKQVDVIVNIGDFADMHSLSFWDKGKIQFEGRRVQDDLACAEFACELLYGSAMEQNPEWWDNKVTTAITLGNHEYRINRAIESAPELDGILSPIPECYFKYHDHVIEFGDTIEIDGIAYSHFFQDHNSGRPVGGLIHTKLRKIGQSFTAGHSPGFEYAEVQNFAGTTRIGLVAGAGYLHYEDYKKGQGNRGHWRGMVIKNEVRDGNYDIMKVSLDYLCRKYEGMELEKFANSPDKWICYGEPDLKSMRWLK